MTKEIFERALSSRGSLSSKQLRLIGLKFKNLPAGWKDSVIGKEFDDDVIKEFLELKDAHLKKSGHRKIRLTIPLYERLAQVCDQHSLCFSDVVEIGLDAICRAKRI